MNTHDKKEEKIVVENLKETVRADLFLKEKTGSSRSIIQRLIKNKNILLNDKVVKPSSKIKNGDVIYINYPEPEAWEVMPEEIPLNIIYEDKDLIVLNKPSGMAVHPGAGRKTGTLAGALLSHCGNLSVIGGKLRPGIVHRLDKDTSGIMLVAKNDKTHLELSRQFSERTIKKEYIALVHGNFNNTKGIIASPVGRSKKNRKKMAVTDNGKPAETKWEVIKALKDFTLLKIIPATGRTHQIRVHLSSIGHPIAGDQTYGGRKNPFGLKFQALHAYKIGFSHPTTKKYLEFTAPLPAHLEEILKRISK